MYIPLSQFQELEVQLQTDSDAAQDEIQSLEEQLEEEKRKREDADHELHKQKQVCCSIQVVISCHIFFAKSVT